MMLRGPASAVFRNQAQLCNKLSLMQTSQRFFRPPSQNIYRADPTPISEKESTEQESKPVWERVFDHKKYMKHEGPLKLSTGIAYLDVEPFPRMKLMKLYYLCIQELKDLPDAYGYKFLCQEMTRFRMQVVDENLSVRAIEEKISAGMIEELIYCAHNEIKLLKIMKSWKPWETLNTNDFDDKEELMNLMAMSRTHPFPVEFERFEDDYHAPSSRRPTAAVHPEDKQ